MPKSQQFRLKRVLVLDVVALFRVDVAREAK
ncbi:hypothetical protein FEP08_04399 [Burkholderia multivorans]|jgi:hypothetical protein|nr:hypothetical protein [Burkholderia multivorans]